MADYRIYQLDMDGDVATEFYARCPDDAAACIEAVRIADGRAEVEVWSGFRRVATLAPQKRWLH